MNYETFEKYLSKIAAKYKRMNDVNSAFDKVGCVIDYPTCIDEAVELLALLANDKYEWISYWVFELNCGEKYHSGSVTDADGNNVPLKTVRDLWNCINNNS